MVGGERSDYRGIRQNVASSDQRIDVRHIVSESFFYKSERIFALRHIIQSQAFHCKRLPMHGKLLQNRVRLFQGLFVLLHVIMLHETTKHILFLLWKETASASLRIGVVDRHDDKDAALSGCSAVSTGDQSPQTG